MKPIQLAALLLVAPATLWAGGKQATVRGYVIDSSCSFTKDLKKPISPECAVACAQAGSPLVIQADNGTIYWPISGDQPASGQNPRLISFAEKRVSVKGKVFEKGGSHAVIIETIEAVPHAD